MNSLFVCGAEAASYGNPYQGDIAGAPDQRTGLSTYAQDQSLLTPEQLQQQTLEQQAKSNPCFSSESKFLNCLKENSENIGICQTLMDEMVSCEKSLRFS